MWTYFLTLSSHSNADKLMYQLLHSTMLAQSMDAIVQVLSFNLFEYVLSVWKKQFFLGFARDIFHSPRGTLFMVNIISISRTVAVSPSSFLLQHSTFVCSPGVPWFLTEIAELVCWWVSCIWSWLDIRTVTQDARSEHYMTMEFGQRPPEREKIEAGWAHGMT